MPELPEVETVRRGLAPFAEGSIITEAIFNRPNLRYPFPTDFRDRIVGRTINHVGRRAKYLLWELDGDETIIMHLGMSGSFRVESDHREDLPGNYYLPKSDAVDHDHAVFTLMNTHGDCQIIYNDPRRFGFMDIVSNSHLWSSKHFKGMGVEPTGNELDGDLLAILFNGKNTSLKSALLDQKLIAGLGNIYVCEALWRSGLSPRRKATTVSRKTGGRTNRSERLATNIREVIAEAIEAGGSSLRDHRQANGELGYFQHSFSVYDRENEKCRKPNCEGTISRIVQNGRSTFFCPSCQR